MYMVPPFVAYYGAAQGGIRGLSLLQQAYDQCRLYREVLYDEEAQLWKHVPLGKWNDTNYWATGPFEPILCSERC